MRKITEYKIVEWYHASITESHVNELIEDGWQPLGDLRTISNGTDVRFTQTMVKYEEE